MAEANWRQETDAGDYFGNQKKIADLNNRRPVIRRAADLVGPGINSNAIRITDFNNVLATFNGFFSADAGAANAPNGTDIWVGFVSSDAELGGVQTFSSVSGGGTKTRIFQRAPNDPNTVSFGSWY